MEVAPENLIQLECWCNEVQIFYVYVFDCIFQERSVEKQLRCNQIRPYTLCFVYGSQSSGFIQPGCDGYGIHDRFFKRYKHILGLGYGG